MQKKPRKSGIYTRIYIFLCQENPSPAQSTQQDLALWQAHPPWGGDWLPSNQPPPFQPSPTYPPLGMVFHSYSWSTLCMFQYRLGDALGSQAGEGLNSQIVHHWTECLRSNWWFFIYYSHGSPRANGLLCSWPFSEIYNLDSFIIDPAYICDHDQGCQF